jgi:multidrug efflux pump subunit AcrA (membrane-fusion protein)
VSRKIRLRAITVGVVAILLAAGGVYFVSGRGSAALQYRTAAVTMGTVTQTLPISGNLTPASETALDFGSNGRVQTVNVQAGQAVKAGDILATLDPSSLQASLAQAQATLGAALAKLTQDQAATPTSLASAQASVNSATVNLQNAQVALTDTQAVNAQAVVQAANVVTNANNKLQADTAQQDTDCSGSVTTQCTQDRNAVSADQGAVRTANDAFSSAVVKAQQGNDQATASVNTAKVQLQNAQASLAAVQVGATRQQIQIDQAQIQVDQVAVDSAQRALTQATITAPVDGVIGAVNLVVGQSVSGGATPATQSAASTAGGSATSTPTSHAITVDSPGAFSVIGTVSDAQVGQVIAGQAALVTPAGATQSLSGKVTQVASTATVTSGVATFAVTVTLTGANAALHAGTSAGVSIIVNQVSQVLTLPTSAVHNTATGSSVNVLSGGKPQSRSVTIGASDALRTQVVSGLSAGDQVVIATVSSAVPTTGSTTGGGLLNGAGGGGGGGAGGTRRGTGGAAGGTGG